MAVYKGSIDAVLNFAKSLEFKGNRPAVKLVTQIYETGVKLNQKAMAELEKQFQRLPGLDKWFVEIPVSKLRRTKVTYSVPSP